VSSAGEFEAEERRRRPRRKGRGCDPAGSPSPGCAMLAVHVLRHRRLCQISFARAPLSPPPVLRRLLPCESRLPAPAPTGSRQGQRRAASSRAASSPRGEAVPDPATAPRLAPLLRLAPPSSRLWPGFATPPRGPPPGLCGPRHEVCCRRAVAVCEEVSNWSAPPSPRRGGVEAA
jgi:hypothetical protein